MSDCSFSPYLSRLIERFGQPTEHTAHDAIATLAGADAANLPELKARFNLGWAYLALSQQCPFKDLGRLQSTFADGAVEIALRAAWHAEKLPGEPQGLFILGLGKLGGHDLNFSSDIDLIAYYDPDVLPVPESRGQAYITSKVMKRMTKILMPPHDPDFVYRVDWRLRPEASVTGLALSTSRAQDFYFFRALPWHRLALLKARVIAGDKTVGDSFLADLSPFIWRQNLDFRAIDELAELKTRINLEHPRMKVERVTATPIMEHPLGFNVKLGTGGIREVEFITNAKQMIWGGKHYALRTTNTLEALQALKDEGLFEAADTERLTAAYCDHRRLENALQMMRNGHEHVLPQQEADWSDIAALMGETPASLMTRTTDHRHIVSTRFSAMFTVTPDASDKTEPVLDAMPHLDEDTQDIVDDWLSGFRRYNIRTSKRARLKPLGAALARRVIMSDVPDAGIRRVDAYLSSLSRSEQYLSLLAANPALLDALVGPLLHSPHMSVLLAQSPHIIDTFLAPFPPTIDFVLAEHDYETRLERLRRFVNEGLFQNYHAFLTGTKDWRELAAALTQQAETVLEAALSIARDDLKAPDLAIAVVGMGKLGQSRMMPQSDLDLIFLFDDGVDRDLATKAVRRLSTILTTPLREGIAYELDMRLRPSGRSGPPAVTLSAFRRHHEEFARNWEHIALAPARIVAGDPDLGAKAEAIIADILNRPRDQAQLIADAHYMWNKIVVERIRPVPTNQFETKLRDGGLMMADFWDSVGKLAEGPRLPRECDGWAELLYWERLLGLSGLRVKDVPDIYAALMPTNLPDHQAKLEQQVRRAVDHYGPANPSAEMRPVIWTT
ncbi:glutamate-ammonia-ligase adenylyltransferase [Algimonas arctica]|uniref:Glutamate-ammonia-ligase adenylyltransferase n=1 Tax=Algimonas arctica TaxID=1479486 RepID=A0A8J3CTC5_9PROT|nr:hypothetical protein [Algimonas arctica]GHA98778.1 glutamate-ammonia-ligase adenylyltransferase [Algimonas arctica]